MPKDNDLLGSKIPEELDNTDTHTIDNKPKKRVTKPKIESGGMKCERYYNF